jgi:hypothetical protein
MLPLSPAELLAADAQIQHLLEQTNTSCMSNHAM